MNKKTENLLFIIIVLIFISLRLAFITQKNLWFDEIFSWNLTLGSFYEILVRTSNDIHPPLFYFVLKIWNFIFGDSVFSMRFLSIVFSTGSVFFIYPISRRVLDEKFAYVVLILFAVNPLNVFYSQEVRMSAMNLFLNAGSVYFLIRVLDKNQPWKIYLKQIDVYCYIFFRVLALYTHYFSFFIFAVEIIYFVRYVFSRERIYAFPTHKLFLISITSIFLLYLPWIPIFIEHITKGQSWRSSQYSFSGISSIPKELVDFVKDINLGLYYHFANLNFIYYLTILLVIIYVSAVILAFIKKEGESLSLLSFMLVFVPVILGLLLSLTQKVELYRYLSIIIPFVLMVIIYGISRVHNKFIEVPLILFLLAVNIYGLSLHYRFDFKNDDYRPIIAHIESNFKEGDKIYVEPHYNGWVIDYYKKQWNLKLPNPVYIRYGWGEIQDSMRVQKPVNFWIIFDYSSVDTTSYGENIKRLKVEYKMQEQETYYLIPVRVELYRFTAK